METIRKNQKEMWEFKNTVTQIKSAFEGVICRLETAEERIGKIEDTFMRTSQRENDLK